MVHKMRKVSSQYENPIDNIFIELADGVSGWFHDTGHTPNVITGYSAVCGAIAINAVHSTDVKLFVISMTLSYFFDCLDGFMARKYDQETRLGDLLDHIKDILVICGIVFVLLKKYGKRAVNVKVIAIAACLIAMMMMNFGCQQRQYANDSTETLDMLKPMCRSPDYITYSRWFGSGTMIATLIVYVSNVMMKK